MQDALMYKSRDCLHPTRAGDAVVLTLCGGALRNGSGQWWEAKHAAHFSNSKRG